MANRLRSFVTVSFASAQSSPAQSVASNPDLRMGQRHFGFAELRHYCFALTNPVGAKFKCPTPCKVEMSVVVVVRWECVKSPHLVISKDCGKGGRPTASSSVFHPSHQAVISTAGAAAIFGL